MTSYISPKTLGVVCGVGFLAYCVYFDRKRRNAPDYRSRVAGRRERERLAKQNEDLIELPPVDDKAAVEKFFVKEIEIGEALMQSGEVDRSVRHLSYAVVLCPQPQQLLGYLREFLPTDAYQKLVENISIANKRVGEAYKKIRLLKEDDVE